MSLYSAIAHKKSWDVEQLLKDPGVDPNRYVSGRTQFMWACSDGDADIVKLFLESKRLTTHNERNLDGYTALHYACRRSRKEAVAALMQDPHIDITATSDCESTCFHFVMHRIDNIIDTVRVMLASGRPEIGTLLNARDNVGDTIRDVAVRKGEPRVVKLINAYKEDPLTTREQLRMELGWPAYKAAQLFATIVLLCDDYYAIK